MRRLFQAMAMATAAFLVTIPSAVPAAAMSGNKEEWWFDSLAPEKMAWPKSKGQGVVVAVLSTGVNGKLPDLRGALLPGTDFKGGDGLTDSDSGSGWGTGMASLIAAQGDGPSKWMGLAPEAKILPISDGGDFSPELLAKGLRYATDHGAKVIAIPQGKSTMQPDPCPDEVKDAITYAVQHDEVILAAAGDHGDLGDMAEYPAACPGVIAVGAFDHLAEPWKKTGRKSYVTVSGPGVDVGSLGKDGRLYHYGSGTGQATALAAAEVALMRAYRPGEPARQVVQRIIATATDVGPPGKDDQTGYGAVSLRRLDVDVPSNAPNPVYDRFNAMVAARNTPSPGTTPSGFTSSGLSGSSGLPLLVFGLVAVVVLAGTVVAVIVSRRGRGPAPVGPVPPMGPGPFPPQPYGPDPRAGAPQGPHPQYGPPPPHAPGDPLGGPSEPTRRPEAPPEQRQP